MSYLRRPDRIREALGDIVASALSQAQQEGLPYTNVNMRTVTRCGGSLWVEVPDVGTFSIVVSAPMPQPSIEEVDGEPQLPDWRIIIEPFGEGEGGVHTVLRGEEMDAVQALEGLAELIEQSGVVPDGLEWRNGSGAAVVRRSGKLRYQVRLDCFENDSSSTGAGWLYAVQVPE